MKEWMNDAERDELRVIVEKFNKENNSNESFGSLATSWKNFVIKCKQGYELCIDDYTNDLSVRFQIQRLIGEASPSLKEKLLKEVQSEDEMYLEVTQPASKALLNLSLDESNLCADFAHRLPKKLVGDLKEDAEDYLN